jgi:hypothetical protein
MDVEDARDAQLLGGLDDGAAEEAETLGVVAVLTA